MGYYSQVAVKFMRTDLKDLEDEEYLKYREIVERFTVKDMLYPEVHEELTKSTPKDFPLPVDLLSVFRLYGFNVFVTEEDVTLESDDTRFCPFYTDLGSRIRELMDTLDSEQCGEFYAYTHIGQEEGDEICRGLRTHLYVVKTIELDLPEGASPVRFSLPSARAARTFFSLCRTSLKGIEASKGGRHA